MTTERDREWMIGKGVETWVTWFDSLSPAYNNVRLELIDVCRLLAALEQVAGASDLKKAKRTARAALQEYMEHTSKSK